MSTMQFGERIERNALRGARLCRGRGAGCICGLLWERACASCLHLRTKIEKERNAATRSRAQANNCSTACMDAHVYAWCLR